MRHIPSLSNTLPLSTTLQRPQQRGDGAADHPHRRHRPARVEPGDCDNDNDDDDDDDDDHDDDDDDDDARRGPG